MKARRTPFAMVPLWIYDHPTVTGTVMGVYLGLAALTYERTARSSISEIGDRAGLGKSATYEALSVLQAIGAVEREGRDQWFLPLDEPHPDSATAANPSATTESDSATAERTSTTRDLPREEEDARAARAQFVDHFWPAYPPRNGRKIGKDKALMQWCRLSLEDRRLAMKGAVAMRREGATPPDAWRWLRDGVFREWAAPPEEGVPVQPSRLKTQDGYASIQRMLVDGDTQIALGQ